VLPKKPAEMPSRRPANLHAPSESPVPEIPFLFCSNWFVQYTDTGPAGQKEDYFATDQWASQPARYASFYIYDAWWNLVWGGNLDSAGCAWVEVPTAGNYFLGHWTNNTQRDGKVFHALFPSGDASGAGQWFNVASNTEFVWLFPTQNDDPIQVAAVTGQILYQDAVTPHGLGLVPNHPYKILTNTGCPFFQPLTDSCYLAPHHPGGGEHGTTLIGTTEIDGVPSANWKYIIAHEIGHHVQDSAMGFYHYNYMDNASEPLCACDYDLSWGNTEHCMQSRENVGGAQHEGFAQAFAGRVFNMPSQSDAIHVYYKPFAEDTWESPALPPSAFDLLDQPRWRQTKCNVVDRGVEMDWMTFFYALTMEYSSDSVPMSEIFSLYRLACGNGTPVPKCTGGGIFWGNLSFWAGGQWADNPNARDYFWAMGAAHGVAN
jgi:hypothetical protein